MNQVASVRQVVIEIREYPGHRRLPASPLRTLRAINDLSASRLARLADVDRSTIRRLEAGIGHPHQRTAQKIAAVLNCPAELLFPLNDVEPAGNRLEVTTSAGVGDGRAEA